MTAFWPPISTAPRIGLLALSRRLSKGMAVSDIARALGVAQRPLYRRIESMLKDLRASLERAGIDAAEAANLIASAGDRLDFGLQSGKTDLDQPSEQAEKR
jgi:chemotaxis regulatin CheY-phosphate phosphatase CheZ